MLRTTPTHLIVCGHCKKPFSRLQGHALWLERSHTDLPDALYWATHKFVCKHGTCGETFFCASCSRKGLGCPQCGTYEEGA